MQVLVLNTGSSSVKFSLIESGAEEVLLDGLADWSVSPARFEVRDPRAAGPSQPPRSHAFAVRTPREAVMHVLQWLLSGDRPLLRDRTEVGAIGHRVVHGGPLYTQSVLVNDEVKAGLASLGELAPLHNPINLEGIVAAEAAWPGVPQVAVFDTAFHATLSAAARTYPIPTEWSTEWSLRRYGFHGLSHAYCTARAAQLLHRDDARLVICHLGQGCSLAAVRAGACVDTSMGFTPLDGLMMGTRSGSVDPGLLIYVLRRRGLSADDLDRILNRESGLLGVSGVSADMRQVQTAAETGNERARLALDVFVHRLRQTIGAMAATLNGLDALVFTAGIGEHSASIRAAACQGLEYLGLHLDAEANQQCKRDGDVASSASPGRILVMETREDVTIVRETVRVLGK
jgi:acetate kinase